MTILSVTPAGLRKGFGLCRACLARVTRIPKDGSKPVCRFCKYKHEFCAVCDEPLKGVTDVRQTPEGPAHRACAREHDPEKVCPSCGGKTRKLSRNLKRGITEPVCDSCRVKKAGRKNCGYCRKYRLVAMRDPEGRPVCPECAETGAQQVICRRCSNVRPHFIDGFCFDCYCLGLADRRHLEFREQIRQDWVRDLFDRFHKEESARAPWKQRYSTQIRHYANFFVGVSNVFQHPDELTAYKLYSLALPYDINRFRIPMAFLHAAGFPVIPEKEDREVIFREYYRRRAIQEAEGAWWADEIGKFADFMEKLNKEFGEVGRRKFEVETTRAYLGMAADFFGGLPPEVSDLRQITDEHATAFLARRTYVHGRFSTLVEYLNQVVRLFQPIRIRKRKVKTDVSQVLPEALHERLVRKWRKVGDNRLVEGALCLLMIRYAQTPGQIEALPIDACREENGEVFLKLAKETIPAPERDAKLFRRYLAKRSEDLKARGDEKNPYLFPSDYRGKALSRGSIAAHPKKYRLNTKVLRGSALLRFFRNSDAPPKVTVECFGVDLSTAIRYFKMAGTEIRTDMKVHESFEAMEGEPDGEPEDADDE